MKTLSENTNGYPRTALGVVQKFFGRTFATKRYLAALTDEQIRERAGRKGLRELAPWAACFSAGLIGCVLFDSFGERVPFYVLGIGLAIWLTPEPKAKPTDSSPHKSVVDFYESALARRDAEIERLRSELLASRYPRLVLRPLTRKDVLN